MKGITLIGMPGAGKSTIGKKLAKKLKFKFVDLDILIKDKDGKSHTSVLEGQGEKKLLSLESQYTLALNLEKTVFSPGGSIVYSPVAMEKLRNETTIIYLDLPISIIKKRLGKNINQRGIVGLAEKGLDGLFSERTPLYLSAAHYVIPCVNLSDEKVINKIHEILQHKP